MAQVLTLSCEERSEIDQRSFAHVSIPLRIINLYYVRKNELVILLNGEHPELEVFVTQIPRALYILKFHLLSDSVLVWSPNPSIEKIYIPHLLSTFKLE